MTRSGNADGACMRAWSAALVSAWRVFICPMILASSIISSRDISSSFFSCSSICCSSSARLLEASSSGSRAFLPWSRPCGSDGTGRSCAARPISAEAWSSLSAVSILNRPSSLKRSRMASECSLTSCPSMPSRSPRRPPTIFTSGGTGAAAGADAGAAFCATTSGAAVASNRTACVMATAVRLASRTVGRRMNCARAGLLTATIEGRAARGSSRRNRRAWAAVSRPALPDRRP